MDSIKYIEDSCVKRFIKSAKQIHEFDPSINIDYGKYIEDYNKASKILLPLMAKLKLKDFIFLCTKFPNLDFTFEGRLKSEYSYFNKIIKEHIDGKFLDSSTHSRSLVYDTFAFRIILNSVSYDVNDSFSITNEKKNRKEYQFVTGSQDNDNKTYRLNEGDIIQFSNGDSISVTSDNIVDMNNRIYVITESGSYLPINGAKIVKSDRSTLDNLLYDIQNELSQFYEENSDFEHLENRDKDYVKHPKKLKYSISGLKDTLANASPDILIKRLKYHRIDDKDSINISRGPFLPCYQSLHQSYYYRPYNTFFENQIRTIHMHNIAEYSSTFGHDVYKSNRMDENSLSKLPTFITYSRKILRGKPNYSYEIHDIDYSVQKSFGISLEDFYKQYHEIHSGIEDTKEGLEI